MTASVVKSGLLLSLLLIFGVLGIVLPLRPAEATELREAVTSARQFLSLWLVQDNIDEALKFLSPQPQICSAELDGTEVKLMPREQVIGILRTGMSLLKENLGERSSLGEAIKPLPEDLREIFGVSKEVEPSEFSIAEGSPEWRECGEATLADSRPTAVIIFLFNVPEELTDGMYFVFQRESDGWKIVGLDRLRQ